MTDLEIERQKISGKIPKTDLEKERENATNIKNILPNAISGALSTTTDPVKRLLSLESGQGDVLHRIAAGAGDAGQTILNAIDPLRNLTKSALIGAGMNATPINENIAKLSKYLEDSDIGMKSPHAGPGMFQDLIETMRAAPGYAASAGINAAPLLLGLKGDQGAGIESTAKGKINKQFQDILPKDMSKTPKSFFEQNVADKFKAVTQGLGKQIGDIKANMPSATKDVPGLDGVVSDKIKSFVADNLKQNKLDPSDANFLLKMSQGTENIKNFDTLDNFIDTQRNAYGNSLYAGGNKRVDTSTRLVQGLMKDLNDTKYKLIENEPGYTQLRDLNEKYGDIKDLHTEAMNNKEDIANHMLNKIMASDKSVNQYLTPSGVKSEISNLALKDLSNASTKNGLTNFDAKSFGDYFDNIQKTKLSQGGIENLYGPDTFGKLKAFQKYLSDNPLPDSVDKMKQYLDTPSIAARLLNDPSRVGVLGMQNAPVDSQINPALPAVSAAISTQKIEDDKQKGLQYVQ